LRTLDNHTATVHDLAVRPGQPGDAPPLVASVSDDRTLRLWQPTIGRMVRFAKLSSPPLAVAWSADGKRLATSCIDGHLRVLDPDTLQATDLPALDGRAHAVAAGAADAGSFVVGGAGAQIKVMKVSASK
jgi:WD40 repeat protein